MARSNRFTACHLAHFFCYAVNMVTIKEDHKSLLLIAGLITAAYLLFDFLLILFVSFLLITAFLPLVRILKAKKVPKVLSSVILVFAIFAIPIGLLISLGPAIVSQTQSLVDSAPQLLQAAQDKTGITISGNIGDTLREQLPRASSYVFSFSTTVLTIAVSIVAIIVLTIYGLIYYDETSRAVIAFAARGGQPKSRYEKLLKGIEGRVGTWVKAQLIVSLLIGILSGLAYVVLGLPFAGALAILAGVLELLPGLGPTLAAIPALLVALTVSPNTFFLTLIAYLFIQAMESYLITPKVMSSAIKLNPFITIVIVLLGTFLLGVLGAFLAIPLALLVGELYKHISAE